MGLFGYTFRTFNRLRHGEGFGVHSPFAYMFIREVLRLPKKYGFYCYHELDYWHDKLFKETGHPQLPVKYLKMIFRVGNHFGVRRAVVVGGSDPLPVLAATAVNSQTVVTVCHADNKFVNEDVKINSPRSKQIVDSMDMNDTFASLHISSSRPLIIITAENPSLDTHLFADELREKDPVYIVLHLKKNRAVWNRIQQSYTEHGMSFANPHVGVMVPDKGLPRQHFNIWI